MFFKFKFSFIIFINKLLIYMIKLKLIIFKLSKKMFYTIFSIFKFCFISFITKTRYFINKCLVVILNKFTIFINNMLPIYISSSSFSFCFNFSNFSFKFSNTLSSLHFFCANISHYFFSNNLKKRTRSFLQVIYPSIKSTCTMITIKKCKNIILNKRVIAKFS